MGDNEELPSGTDAGVIPQGSGAEAASEKVTALQLESFGGVGSAVIDANAGFAYFGNYSASGAKVLKVDLAAFTQAAVLSLAVPEAGLQPGLAVGGAVIDTANHILYLGQSRGKVVKVDLANFSRVGAVSIGAAPAVWNGVLDPVNGFVYFTSGGHMSTELFGVAGVRLSDFTLAETIKFDNVTSNANSTIHGAVIDTIRGFAYFGTQGAIPDVIEKVPLLTN